MRTARQRLKLLSGTVSHDQATHSRPATHFSPSLPSDWAPASTRHTTRGSRIPSSSANGSGTVVRPLSNRPEVHNLPTPAVPAVVPGDTAECGSYEGMSSYLILAATKGEDRTHHIFDSFMGLSSPTTEDTVGDPEVFRWQKHSLTAPEQLLRRNLAPFDNFLTYPGWIPEAIRGCRRRKIQLRPCRCRPVRAYS